MKSLDRILIWAKEQHPELYCDYMEESYEEMHGPHFNEEKALNAVSHMHSTNERNEREDGEHWSIDDVRSAITPTEHLMRDRDTIWDAYVALNMWYHDLAKNYRSHTDSYSTLWMVNDAMTWAFDDEDAPEGKIYRYIKAVS